MDGLMEKALLMVTVERERQIEKWGDQSENHPFEWVSILSEEVGELAEAINETCFVSEHVKREKGGTEAIIREAVQVAAVATAIVEAMLKIGAV